MMKSMLFRLLLLVSMAAYGSGAAAAQGKAEWVAWQPGQPIEYQAVYHFGDSEWESDLVLIHCAGKWYAQIVSGRWAESEKLAWIWNYENLSNVRIEGNKFYSDKTNGEFVVTEGRDGRQYGLRVYKSWSAQTGSEIGWRSHSTSIQFPGLYPQASLRLLTKDELFMMKKQDLKIMRNEIYARYNYIFESDKDLDIYFTALDWYTAMHKNVDKFQTDLEKENIRLIELIEASK